jgi:hypothetical protein
MILSILAAVVLAVGPAVAALYLGNWFWSTEYSKTNKQGDGGGPFGGVWTMMSGVMIALFANLYVGPYVIPAAWASYVLFTGLGLGFVGGIVPLFRSRKK